ncbi:hypothetical protein GC197_17030 [bacterium]|nr:hypothetical protein [bacterium]
MDVANPSKESWRHLRKYMRSIKKRLPGFQQSVSPVPQPEIKEEPQPKPVVIDRTPVEFGELQSRDQFPQLLRQLGLNGFGLELGVAQGTYSKHLLEQSDLRILFSVDRWSDHHDDVEAIAAHHLLSQHGLRSCVLRMTFEEASEIFDESIFDFIFLDGYAHLGQDGVETLITWWNKLKPGGIFAGHDYHPHWPKTIEVVDHFTARLGLKLNTTHEDPQVVEHAFPSWYVLKPAE